MVRRRFRLWNDVLERRSDQYAPSLTPFKSTPDAEYGFLASYVTLRSLFRMNADEAIKSGGTASEVL